jgi:hypothetical protein
MSAAGGNPVVAGSPGAVESDGPILVVSAADGPMPQTREHISPRQRVAPGHVLTECAIRSWSDRKHESRRLTAVSAHSLILPRRAPVACIAAGQGPLDRLRPAFGVRTFSHGRPQAFGVHSFSHGRRDGLQDPATHIFSSMTRGGASSSMTRRALESISRDVMQPPLPLRRAGVAGGSSRPSLFPRSIRPSRAENSPR